MERMDDLQHNGLVLFQDGDYARFSADALLLLDFLRLKQNDRVVELGSGTGVICVLGKDIFGSEFTGVERQERLVALSQKSAAYNRQEIRFVQADVQNAPDLLGRGVFTAAVTNPPYFRTGDRSGNASAALSRHEGGGTLDVFLSAAFQMLDNGGTLFIVYPAAALTELICSLRAHRLEPKKLRFACSVPGGKVVRVLVAAKKLGNPGLIVEPTVPMQRER
jgi:tRNA1(Val) A37 N6-methylase TrmN6